MCIICTFIFVRVQFTHFFKSNHSFSIDGLSVFLARLNIFFFKRALTEANPDIWSIRKVRVMKNEADREDENYLESKSEISLPTLYQVVLCNDDFTPMEFVMGILEKF